MQGHSPFLIVPGCIIFALLFFPGICKAEENIGSPRPGLSASLDRDSAGVGNIVMLTLMYHLPERGRLPDKPEIKGLEGLTILGRTIDSHQIRIKLLVDRLGTWKSGPISLTYLDKGGKPQMLKTNPVSLKVLSNLGDRPEEAQLRPIQGIIPIRPLWLEHLPIVAGALTILLAVSGLIWWYKKRGGSAVSILPEDPPYIRAKKQIEELEAQRLFEQGHIKEFYFRFSEILRSYLGSLRGFPGVEFTTEEIALRVRQDEDRRLLPLLRQADLVKFADTVPTLARKEEEVKGALFYIKETSPLSEEHRSANGRQGAGQ